MGEENGTKKIIFKHDPNSYFVPLRADYRQIAHECLKKTGKIGRASVNCMAFLLAVMEKWTVNLAGKGHSTWVTKSYQKFSEEIYEEYGRCTIMDSLDVLVACKLLERKATNGQGVMYQFKCNMDLINKLLDASSNQQDLSQMIQVSTATPVSNETPPISNETGNVSQMRSLPVSNETQNRGDRGDTDITEKEVISPETPSSLPVGVATLPSSSVPLVESSGGEENDAPWNAVSCRELYYAFRRHRPTKQDRLAQDLREAQSILAANWTREQFRSGYWNMKHDSFWKDKALTLEMVGRHLEEYAPKEAPGGKPPPAASRPTSPSGSVPSEPVTQEHNDRHIARLLAGMTDDEDVMPRAERVI